MRPKATDEGGFALIELVFAIVILNIGILALIGSLGSGISGSTKAAASSRGTVVADKVMEVYRDLRNCAIYLHGGTGNDSSGFPDGIPNSTSAFYSAYSRDTNAYAGSTYFSNGTPSSTPLWVTENSTGSGYSPIPASSSTCAPTGLVASTGIDPTKAVQQVTGPDGQPYTTFTYIVITQPSGTGWTAGYVKRVTVDVVDPRNSPHLLARESSIFDPNEAP